ncbi:MAG: hydrogenase 4 subunit F [Nitrospira sp.]|nr:hydrogenase 4 subunit F [Nitrospira sp.]MCP9443202.1 hydrogenase 4 subunit F [Nitrospira sp.]
MTGTSVAPVAIIHGTPIVAAMLSLATTRAPVLHGLNLATMTALVVSELAIVQRVLEQGSFTSLWDFVYLDALSAFILLIITAIGFLCSLYTWSYLDDYVARGAITPRRVSRFFFLFHLFLFTMIAATTANNLGVLWIAMEGTTLATVFLISFFRRREGFEAGWKYLILCSVGIALALFGTVLTYYSSVRVLGDVSAAMNVTTLQDVAHQLDPHVLKLAFLFIVVGYGTKVGLAPMHSWLPEAYSEAPAPVVAMLAGVLETVAVYALLRSKTIVDHALPEHYTGNLLILFGLLSFVVAALFILIQHDYKRLFAYSSIEHMGIAMAGFGVGGVAGTFGGLFHLLNHALAKSLAFFSAGNVHRRFGTREIKDVRGLMTVQPVTATAMLVATLALVGMPPFSTFLSELTIVSALATQSFSSDTLHLGRFLTIVVAHDVRSLAIVALFLLFMVVLFGGFTYRVTSMIWGPPPDGVKRGEGWEVGQVPLVVTCVVLAGLGLTLPEPIRGLMDQAVHIILSAR